MNRTLTITCLLIGLLFYADVAYTQISGIVNQYTEVVTIDYANASVEVINPGLFSINDRVLLIQMKGAQMASPNNSTFGDITDINGAGLYELATVCDVIGNDVFFPYLLHNNYNPLGDANPRIQLVKVYSGTNETVTGMVTASAWNGTTGGIVAIELSGTLTMNADINVSGQGFRGGFQAQSTATCNFFTNSSDFYYPINGGATEGGRKGEGITADIANREYGKGAQVNGGGGGNNHNAGGGGGSNYATGGNGGTRVTSGFNCQGNHPGVGGEALSAVGYSGANNQVFMGGGGGAGHDNNNVGQDAGNGGGIVLIIADQIEGNGNSIRASGETPGNAPGDGGAGGGAGGAILLSTNGYGSTNLNLTARGGSGGTTSVNCEGPGGGGSGGVIWVATPPGGGVIMDVTGGVAGTANACGGSTNGATVGNAGVSQGGLTIPEEIVNLSTCVLDNLPILSGELTPKGEPRLFWPSQQIPDGSRITLERKQSEDDFQVLSAIPAHEGTWTDPSPFPGENIYRLKLRNPDGSVFYTNLVSLRVSVLPGLNLIVSPTPANKYRSVMVQFTLVQEGLVEIQLFNQLGKRVLLRRQPVSSGRQQVDLSVSDLPAGIYSLRVNAQGRQETRPLVLLE